MSTHTEHRPSPISEPGEQAPPTPRGKKGLKIAAATAGLATTATAVVFFAPNLVGALGQPSPEDSLPADTCLANSTLFSSFASEAIVAGGPDLGVTLNGDLEGSTGVLVYRATVPSADSPSPADSEYTEAAWLDFPTGDPEEEPGRFERFAVQSDGDKVTWVRMRLGYPLGSAACGPDGITIQNNPTFEDVPKGSLPSGVPVVGF